MADPAWNDNGDRQMLPKQVSNRLDLVALVKVITANMTTHILILHPGKDHRLSAGHPCLMTVVRFGERTRCRRSKDTLHKTEDHRKIRMIGEGKAMMSAQAKVEYQLATEIQFSSALSPPKMRDYLPSSRSYRRDRSRQWATDNLSGRQTDIDVNHLGTTIWLDVVHREHSSSSSHHRDSRKEDQILTARTILKKLEAIRPTALGQVRQLKVVILSLTCQTSMLSPQNRLKIQSVCHLMQL
jgi:hypothetical protein